MRIVSEALRIFVEVLIIVLVVGILVVQARQGQMIVELETAIQQMKQREALVQ